MALATSSADAKQKQAKPEKAEAQVAEVDNSEPMFLVVSVGQQKVDIYRGTHLLTTAQVSTGTAQHPTLIGAFSILEKQRWHHSNIYSGAPMPWMNRITWSGTALHAGVVPGYPASHGCIRLTYSFAPKLFQMTTVGDNVVVSRGRPVPSIIEHPALFQPLPPQSASLELDTPKMTAIQPISSPLTAMAAASSHLILAKAEGPTAVDAEPQVSASVNADEPKAEDQAEAPYVHVPDIAAADPNRVHAITPDLSEAKAQPAVDKTQPTKAVDSMDPTKTGSADTNVAAVTLPSPVPGPEAAATAPNAATTKLDSGAMAAAKLAAEPPSNAPLRILITRRTQRDRIIGIQQILADMGKLPQQNFDGTMGKATITAVKDFQKENGLAPSGAITDELIKKVYEVAGKGEPPAGHLYVRQKFDDLFDAPVSFRDPDEPLGTHVYTALKFAPGDTKARWMTVNVADDASTSPLDRLEVPADLREKISRRLTPGSTLIVADTSINSASLPRGGDFVVLARASSAKVSATDDQQATPKPKRRAVARRSYDGGDDFGFGYSQRSSRNNFFRGGRQFWYGRPW